MWNGVNWGVWYGPCVICSDGSLRASTSSGSHVLPVVLGMSKRLWKELLLHLPRPKQKGQILAVCNGTPF